MSIVGYVLGLGDRHPSNIMLDRGSGKLLHIDFGGACKVPRARTRLPALLTPALNCVEGGKWGAATMHSTHGTPLLSLLPPCFPPAPPPPPFSSHSFPQTALRWP